MVLNGFIAEGGGASHWCGLEEMLGFGGIYRSCDGLFIVCGHFGLWWSVAVSGLIGFTLLAVESSDEY